LRAFECKEVERVGPLKAEQGYIEAPKRRKIMGITQLSFWQARINSQRPPIFQFGRRPIPIEKQAHIAKPDVRARQVGIKLNSSQCRLLCFWHHLGRRTVIRCYRVVGPSKGRVEAGVLWVLRYGLLKVPNRP